MSIHEERTGALSMDKTRNTSDHEFVETFPLVFLDTRRFIMWVAIELSVVVALVAFLQWSGYSGPQLALIPTLIAITAKKFFGKSKDVDAAFGDHPAVAFTFKALATGELEDVNEMVAEDFTGYANGYTTVDPEGGNGPEAFVENTEYWRRAVPDLAVAIYDEVSRKDPDKTDSIAVRFVLSGTLTGQDLDHEFETEAAAFIKVVDHKLTEWRVVVDTAYLDELADAMGHTLSQE
jgi:hypothetical protein